MFDQALLIASSDADLNALAQTIVMATTSRRENRQENLEAAEIKCLLALMAHEKSATKPDLKPSFTNILALFDKPAIDSVLQESWTANEDKAFRQSILGSLSMRLSEVSLVR